MCTINVSNGLGIESVGVIDTVGLLMQSYHLSIVTSYSYRRVYCGGWVSRSGDGRLRMALVRYSCSFGH